MVKMTDQPMYGRRAYVIVGVNKKDPTDIIGYCENSFSMGWTKHWVNVWANHGKAIAKENAEEYNVKKFCELYEKGEEYCKHIDSQYRGKYGRFLEKVFSGKATFEEVKQEVRNYCVSTSSYASQNEWNHVRHYPSYVPRGYEVKVFRLNSKHCPIICDLRYRHLMEHRHNAKEFPWSKWDYRNPMFAVKAKVGLGFKWPEDILHSNKLKKEEVSCKNAKVQFTDLPKSMYEGNGFGCKGKEFKQKTRSEKQILRKQRRNSFAAKEGKLARGRASKHCP